MLWQGQSEEVVAQMNASGESRLWSQLSRKQQQLVCKIGFWQVMFFFWGGTSSIRLVLHSLLLGGLGCYQ